MPVSPIALGADDPLLFGSRLVGQYEAMRDAHGFTDAELAELARMSVRGSAAPRRRAPHRLLADIDTWLAPPLRRLSAALEFGGSSRTGRGYEVAADEDWVRGRSVMPNGRRARRRGSRGPGRAASAVVAPPRLVSASVCLVDSRAGPSP